MARFSKARLIQQLRDRAEEQERLKGFDNANGTGQLQPAVCDEALEALIERAVAYGRWRQLQDMAQDLESGYLGV